jgi:hypothetical protein
LAFSFEGMGKSDHLGIPPLQGLFFRIRDNRSV